MNMNENVRMNSQVLLFSILFHSLRLLFCVMTDCERKNSKSLDFQLQNNTKVTRLQKFTPRIH